MTLQNLYESYIGSSPKDIVELPASGSNRRYFRLTGKQSIIGAIGNCKQENEAFIYMAKHFKSKGLPTPELFAVSDDKMSYLQQDLGDLSLFAAIEKGRLTRSFGNDEKELLTKVIRLLPDIQFKGAEGFDYSKCYPAPEFDMRSIMWD